MKTGTEKENVKLLKNLLNEARDEADELRRSLRKYQNVLLSTKLVMGHELKKPATSISGYLDLVLEALESENKDPETVIEEALESARKARRECRLLDELNRIFIALLKVDGERELPPVQSIDLKAIFEEVINSFPEACRAPSRVDVRISPGMEFINFNIDALKLIITNLIENALLYSNEGSKVRVRVEKVTDKRRMSERELMKITVSDHGEGIPKEYLQKIFSPFVRLNKDKTGGTGLGLTLVRSLVELHGGEISLNSQKGKGTTVYLTVPIVENTRDQVDA